MLNLCIVMILIFISSIVFLMVLDKEILHKILFLNSLTSLIVLFICALGTYKSNSSYIDIAIIYSILSFIATYGYLRFFTETNITKEVYEEKNFGK